MSVRLICPDCGAKLTSKKAEDGARVRCPECGELVRAAKEESLRRRQDLEEPEADDLPDRPRRRKKRKEEAASRMPLIIGLVVGGVLLLLATVGVVVAVVVWKGGGSGSGTNGVGGQSGVSSKATKENVQSVHHGMSQKEVEDILGQGQTISESEALDFTAIRQEREQMQNEDRESRRANSMDGLIAKYKPRRWCLWKNGNLRVVVAYAANKSGADAAVIWFWHEDTGPRGACAMYKWSGSPDK